MKNIRFLLRGTLLLFSITITVAQDLDPRWELTRPIETEIEKYLKANIGGFQLSEAEVNRIADSEEHKDMTPQEVSAFVLRIKRSQLRRKYFEENPESRDAFQAINTNGQVCSDGNFEGVNPLINYTFSNYTENYSDFYACTMELQPGSPLPISNTLNNFNADYTLVTQGFDPALAAAPFNVNLPRTFNGTTQAIKLNRSSQGLDVTTMQRDFVVNENNLSINFSLILENPDHFTTLPDGSIKDEQPFFQVTLYDVNGNVFYRRCIVSDPNNCIFTSADINNTLLYSGWRCLNIDTQILMNQPVTLEFSIVDCGLGGHYGTVYIDEICNTTCTNNAFGDILLDPVNSNCPTNSFDVCGSYQTPLCATGSPVFSLEIIDNVGNVVNTLNNAAIDQTNQRFCFSVDLNDFGSNPAGNYEFNVIGDFITNTGFVNTIIDLSANVGPDVAFNNCPCPGIIPSIAIANNAIGCPILLTGSNTGVSCGGETYVWEVYNDIANDGLDPGDIVYTTNNVSFDENDFDFTFVPGNYFVSLTITDASGTIVETTTSSVTIQDECYFNCDANWLKSIGTSGGASYQEEFGSNVVVDNEDNVIMLGYSSPSTT
ncbi:MAG: hypothetical protein K0U54_02890, partial [Bacteroidetes bacterium]|nr:hypothetical protein [Bacteroidota bacterium]